MVRRGRTLVMHRSIFTSPAASDHNLPVREILDSGVGLRYASNG